MKVKLAIAIISVMTLSGCASVFNAVADSADRADLCQTATHSTLTGARLKPDGHQRPHYCFSSAARQVITDRNGHIIGYVRK